MSNGSFSSSLKDAISDYIKLEFETEKYSIPSSAIGFKHGLDGIENNAIKVNIESRIKDCLINLSSTLGTNLSLESYTMSDDNKNISLVINSDYEQINITV